jgi:ApbE superfamily uncharacterized protein (UPF0280 family)
MNRPSAAYLSGDRLHLQHGPIDLIIGVDGAREVAFAAARERFETILTELVEELPLLRSPLKTSPRGTVAKRMYAAAQPHAQAVFVTPMAAVAGAVADEVLSAMVRAAPLTRAYINNGGDIAIHLAAGYSFNIAMAGLNGGHLGHITIPAESQIRGIATSGQGGRSHSMGIAQSVTVLAQTAAQADVAATLIANAVDLPDHPAIRRRPAYELAPDSDLGHRLVVTQVGALSAMDVRTALAAGQEVATSMTQAGLIHTAALTLQGQTTTAGDTALTQISTERTLEHA